MVENAETAITKACQETGAIVSDYTAAPMYFKDNEKGGHEWLIEFERAPSNQSQFCDILDLTLQEINSDYEAKRTKNIALGPPLVRFLPRGTFHHWMKGRGKLGGQHKVPRLANERRYVEEILEMMETSSNQ